MRATILGLLLLAFAAPTASADEVVDAQGRTHAGIITKFTEKVIHLRTGFGLLSFKWKEVNGKKFKQREYEWPVTSGKAEPRRSLEFLTWWKSAREKAAAAGKTPEAPKAEGPPPKEPGDKKPGGEKKSGGKKAPKVDLAKKPTLLPARTVLSAWAKIDGIIRDTSLSLQDRRDAYSYFRTARSCEILMRVGNIKLRGDLLWVVTDNRAWDLKNRLIGGSPTGQAHFRARLDGKGSKEGALVIPLAKAKKLRRGDVLRVRLTGKGILDKVGRATSVRWLHHYVGIHQQPK